ncbi:MAG: ROK family transcriptional regulator [Microbacterium sp.]
MNAQHRYRRARQDAETTGATANAILYLVSSGTAVTRVSIARALGVSASTVTVRVSELIAAGLLTESGQTDSTGGRRARLLSITSRSGILLAAAFGRNHVRCGLLDLSGTLLDVREIHLDVSAGPEAAFSRVIEIWHTLAGGAERSELQGIGVSLPGPVDSRTGQAVSPAGLPGWNRWGVADWLRGEFGAAAVVVDNDANASALGEFTARAAGGDRPPSGNLMHVKAGSSLGGGLVLQGRVHRGSTWIGGDIAHVRVAVAGARPCSCGNIGCLETIAGGRAIIADLREEGIAVADTAELTRLANLGVPEVSRRVRAAGVVLGETLATLVNFVNPDIVTIGGFLSEARPFLAAATSMLYDGCHPLATESLRVEQAVSGRDAEVFGIGQLILRQAISALG